MSTFLDDLLKKMKTAPHVGVPSVTNPKLPTKVEKATAEYAARQKAMPKFVFGTGTPLERLQKKMVIAHHPTPKFADPAFTPNKSQADAHQEAFFDGEYQNWIAALRAEQKEKGNL